MRLWHKDIIDVLPSKMLVAQWRELSAIVGSINKNGTPNHRLVNIVLDYSKEDYYIFSMLVYNEMKRRNMKPSLNVLNKIEDYTGHSVSKKEIYKDWHNNRYLDQCYYNLQEKYDRGIITKEEWELIDKKYNDLQNWVIYSNISLEVKKNKGF